MSHASENPVYCAMRESLGCPASHPSGRWGSQKAANEGWFASRQDELSYCPEHVPDWVPAWRAQQAAKKYEVMSGVSVAPAVLACAEGDLDETTDTEPAEDTVKALRARAFEHGRQTGHTVTVFTARTLTVERSYD